MSVVPLDPCESSSSGFIPGLAENEVELVIDKFWRSTRPRVCIRSEAKSVAGFAFRLLVWPQGSKQSQNFLSAFVEVLPAGLNATLSQRSVSSDWVIPSVYYKIAVLNFRQKWVYAKTDTWTFSNVCPDRGWHTLLDTRYINRRDGYLSPEGSLVIRATISPRFSRPLPALPLRKSSGVSRSIPPLKAVLGNEKLTALILGLFLLPGFRKAVYGLGSGGSGSTAVAGLREAELVLDSICAELREVMENVTGRTRGETPPSIPPSAPLPTIASLRHRLHKSLVVIEQLGEVMDDVGGSDIMREKLENCRNRLFNEAPMNVMISNSSGSSDASSLVIGLQKLFAKIELKSESDSGEVFQAISEGCPNQLSAIMPENMFSIFFSKLTKPGRRRSYSDQKSKKTEDLASFFSGELKVSGKQIPFSHLILKNGRGVNLEKALVSWLGGTTVPVEYGGGLLVEAVEIPKENPEKQDLKFSLLPPILVVQLANRVKDRLDVSEVVDFTPFFDGNPKTYRLHAIILGHGANGVDTAQSAGNYQHYSTLSRKSRRGGWYRDDGDWMVELPKFEQEGYPGVDWVFSADFACSTLIYYRDDCSDRLFERGVDVRFLRPDLLKYVGNSNCSSEAIPSAFSTPNPTPPSDQLSVTFVTEKDLTNLSESGFFSVFKSPLSSTLTSGSRKLLVRRDVTVERLMEAVTEHFKIPFNMQRLFALHYFEDVLQERFEAMEPGRAVSSFLGNPGPLGGLGNGVIVLVSSNRLTPSAKPEIPNQKLCTLVWKFLRVSDLSIITGGLLTVGPGNLLSDYFEHVSRKIGREINNFDVYEEFGPRLVEQKKTNVSISEESLGDGDVLIFVEKINSEKIKSDSVLPIFVKRRTGAEGKSVNSDETDLGGLMDQLASLSAGGGMSELELIDEILRSEPRQQVEAPAPVQQRRLSFGDYSPKSRISLNAVRSKFYSLCPPPERGLPDNGKHKKTVIPPLPRIPPGLNSIARTGGSKKKKSIKPVSFLSEAEVQYLWWKACLAAWSGSVLKASEFVLAAELSGSTVVEDAGVYIYFAWLDMLKAKSETPKQDIADRMDDDHSPLAEDHPTPKSHIEERTESPLKSSFVESTSVPDEWQPAKKGKGKSPHLIKSGIVKPVSSPPSISSNALWLPKLVKKGYRLSDAAGTLLDISCVDPGEAEKLRRDALPEVLKQFVLPGDLVFVISDKVIDEEGGALNAFMTIPPAGFEPDKQLEYVLRSVAEVGVKMERAFVACEEDSVNWFIELEDEISIDNVINWFSSNLIQWKTTKGCLQSAKLV